MSKNNPKTVLKWLKTRPSLAEMCERYPEEWAIVQRDIMAAYERTNPTEKLPGLPNPPSKPAGGKPRAGNGLNPALSKQVRSRMTQMAIKNYGLSATSGVKEGVVRFNWLNGFLINSLLFAQELERKPASLFWFSLLWPLVWQKKRLMPLAESKGIYCFYSQELVEKLAALTGSRSCLEIAAGDGTLTRFLKDRGVQITATDNGSWKDSVEYPDWVVRRDAREALKMFSPEVVICSWPPAGNDFESRVFRTRSVQMYIVIASRHRFASGNWNEYTRQTAFTFEEDKDLTRLVLPPELGSVVYVFRRKAAA